MDKDYRDFIYLVACAINECNVDKKIIEEMELCQVYKIVDYHTMAAVSYYALEQSGVLSDHKWLVKQHKEVKDILCKWKESREKAVRKNFMLDAERAKFFAFCEKEQIWYMPLKGIVLKDIYPKDGMRQMADNDILFDEASRKKVCDYFKNCGYKIISYNKNNHDVYEKNPVFNFEMHTSLYGEGHKKEFYSYYTDVKKMLKKDEENAFGYHFTDEDFYVFMISHANKHFAGGGTGIRTLLDIYVYNVQFRYTMDRKYIECELEKLHLLEFEKMVRVLSYKLFAEPEKFFERIFSEEEERVLGFFANAGTYGTMQNLIEKNLRNLQNNGEKITKRTKIIYCLGRLFPTIKKMRESYEICNRYTFVIPFFYIYRICVKSVNGRKHVYNEIVVIKSVGK